MTDVQRLFGADDQHLLDHVRSAPADEVEVDAMTPVTLTTMTPGVTVALVTLALNC